MKKKIIHFHRWKNGKNVFACLLGLPYFPLTVICLYIKKKLVAERPWMPLYLKLEKLYSTFFPHTQKYSSTQTLMCEISWIPPQQLLIAHVRRLTRLWVRDRAGQTTVVLHFVKAVQCLSEETKHRPWMCRGMSPGGMSPSLSIYMRQTQRGHVRDIIQYINMNYGLASFAFLPK